MLLFLVYFSLLCAIMAVASGVKVVGTGIDWRFTPREILWGRENALIYIWVTLSTMASIAHTGLIGLWLSMRHSFTYISPLAPGWFAMHSAMGILFTAIHIIVKAKLKADRGLPPRYLFKRAV